MTIDAGELYPIVEAIVRRIAVRVKDTLTELRPEVAADIYDRGVILTGGGAFEVLGPMVPQVAAGVVKALAVSSDRRNPALPEVPTFSLPGWALAKASASFSVAKRELAATNTPMSKKPSVATGAKSFTGS